MSLWSLLITFTLIQGALEIFLQSCVAKLLAWLVIEPMTFDLGSQSGAYDLSAKRPTLSIRFK